MDEERCSTLMERFSMASGRTANRMESDPSTPATAESAMESGKMAGEFRADSHHISPMINLIE